MSTAVDVLSLNVFMPRTDFKVISFKMVIILRGFTQYQFYITSVCLVISFIVYKTQSVFLPHNYLFRVRPFCTSSSIFIKQINSQLFLLSYIQIFPSPLTLNFQLSSNQNLSPCLSPLPHVTVPAVHSLYPSRCNTKCLYVLLSPSPSLNNLIRQTLHLRELQLFPFG